MTHNALVLVYYYFMVIRYIFWISNYFKKLLNSLINSMQGLAWFEVHFSSKKNYKKIIIMCKKETIYLF